MSGLQPVVGAFRSEDGQRLYIFHPLAQYSLADVLRFCPHLLGCGDVLRLLLLQLLQCLRGLQSRGLSHSKICPRHVFVDESRWE